MAATPADAASYSVILSNAYLDLVSPAAFLTVLPIPVPAELTVQRVGSSVAISYAAQARTY